MRTITVESHKLPAHIRHHIAAKSVDVQLIDSGHVTLGSQQWDSGSRTLYHVAALSIDMIQPVKDVRPWPQNMAPLGQTQIPPGWVIIETGTFCGKPATPRIYANSIDVAASLAPPAIDLTDMESKVLKASACYNSMGRKRWRQDNRVSQATWDSTVESLAAKGLMTRNGALTVAGKNQARS